MRAKGRLRYLLYAAAAVAAVVLLFYLLQRFWAHRNGTFIPDYERITLTEDSDYESIFLQTGLGRAAVDKLRSEDHFQAVWDAQNAFFSPPETVCSPLLGWFTREDRPAEPSGAEPVDLQPGDILLTLSTHSAGWRHGHAGLVIDSGTTLECVVLGTDSTLMNAAHWSGYSNWAVLRLKDITPELQREIVQYSLETLYGVPYRLSAGLIGPKAPDPEAPQFGLNCSYLVWYAWNHFGYDLDSDGGRLTSSYDLLRSDLLQVIQLYGMDPRVFLK